MAGILYSGDVVVVRTGTMVVATVMNGRVGGDGGALARRPHREAGEVGAWKGGPAPGPPSTHLALLRKAWKLPPPWFPCCRMEVAVSLQAIAACAGIQGFVRTRRTVLDSYHVTSVGKGMERKENRQ